jgi:DNA (cytosine-5)-methyltransferase 1
VRKSSAWSSTISPGGGGASTGGGGASIEQALGRAVDIAINHDEAAIAMHEANHPGTRHIRNNIWLVDPADVTEGRPVELAWFSPDCKHFSKAKGGKPREKSIRDLAWVVVLWAKRVRPQLILLENVEEFRTWGPLDHDGMPIKERAGETFDKWCRELRATATSCSSASCAPATMARRRSASASS